MKPGNELNETEWNQRMKPNNNKPENEMKLNNETEWNQVINPSNETRKWNETK